MTGKGKPPKGYSSEVSSGTSSVSSGISSASSGMSSASGLAVGIDLGTTFSVVAVWRNGKVEILSDESGSRLTPSTVGFQDGKSVVGQAARDLDATRQVFDAKRIIGRPFNDHEVQADRRRWPFDVLDCNCAPRIKVDVGGKHETFAPEEISAMVLSSLKETAEARLQQEVTKAVITVPAYFNERQRQATKTASTIAGLEVLGMINEPTAAAIAYGLDRVAGTASAKKKTVFIYDLGGGTFDVSIMSIEGTQFNVIASGGDTHIGGQDFDLQLLGHCLKDLRSRHGVDLLKVGDKNVLHDLRKACELAKRRLSTLHEAKLSIYVPQQDKSYEIIISRATFEELCKKDFMKTIELSEKVLADAQVPHKAVDEVLLVGGSTSIPKIRDMVKTLFGGKEPRESMNKDEVVAFGAAIHAAILNGDRDVDAQVKFRDVTSLSLGVECQLGEFSAVIHKNSNIPCSMTKEYVTTVDNQRVCSSKVYQGERLLARENHFLNKEFSVKVPPRPAGKVKIHVTFSIDADGLLAVTAVEPTTRQEHRVTITHEEASLSDADIRNMIEKAKRFKRQDMEELQRLQDELRRLGVY